MAISMLRRSSILDLGCFVASVVVAGCSAATVDEPSALRDDGASESETAATSQDELRVVPPSRSRRIAVVGAGPSGLTAADTLRQLGYANVTVFEKEARVGGKVYSYRSGNTVTELGAILASPDYTYVLGLADKYHIPYVVYSGARAVVDENGNARSAEDFLRSRYRPLVIAAATARYAAVLARFAPVQQPGLAPVPAQAELYLPFDQFAARHGITPIAELVRSVMVGFGYGYYETTPAIYYMKLMGWLVKPSIARGLEQATLYTFPTGYQSLWESVAEGLDVRLSSEVTAVARPSPSGAAVQITVNGSQTFDFDEVIVSAPLNRVANFMALRPQEKTLFAKVASERYDVSVFTAPGLATGEALFFHANARPSRINHVNVWLNAGPSLPYVGYQIVASSASPTQISDALVADVAARGGQVTSISLRQEWDYFAHVNTNALREGFYYDVAALQGANHTFYVGGTLAFETVEHSARQAQALVRRHFPVAFLP